MATLDALVQIFHVILIKLCTRLRHTSITPVIEGCFRVVTYINISIVEVISGILQNNLSFILSWRLLSCVYVEDVLFMNQLWVLRICVVYKSVAGT